LYDFCAWQAGKVASEKRKVAEKTASGMFARKSRTTKASDCFGLACAGLYAGDSKESIAVVLLLAGMTESAIKSLLGKVGCVIGHIKPVAGKTLKTGVVSEMVTWLKGGSVGTCPAGDKSSQAFVKAVWLALGNK
jgi:hypothetical protein